MICPVCETMDLEAARINATGEVISVCKECDSAWPAGVPIIGAECRSVVAYLESCGVTNARSKGGWGRFFTWLGPVEDR